MDEQVKAPFRETVWQQGGEHFRAMPWRDTPTFYYVLVSELMLQQTQVSRVIPKFHEFIATFPDEITLARAPLSTVLRAWQGLGYNRRAKYLHDAAQHIVANGTPTTAVAAEKLSGVGKNTAGAIMNYVYQIPTPFIETNIRTVYFHHFFRNERDVPDAAVLELVAQTLSHEHPREWFWALMDYGAFLKQQGAGALSTGKHYKKQAPLKGSIREMRGRIITTLSTQPLSETDLRTIVQADERFEKAIAGLQKDRLIVVTKHAIQLADSSTLSGV